MLADTSRHVEVEKVQLGGMIRREATQSDTTVSRLVTRRGRGR